MPQLPKNHVPKRIACALLLPQAIPCTCSGAILLLLIRVTLFVPQLHVTPMLPEMAVSEMACHVFTLLPIELRPDQPKPPC